MRFLAQTLLAAINVVGTNNGTPADMHTSNAYSVVCTDVDATPAAIVAASGVAEVDQVTFAAKASTTDGDYFVLSDYTGASWAVALDTTGGAAATPTGAAWVAVPAGHKVYTDISSATTGSDVSALAHTAINALSGFTTNVTCSTSTTHQNCTDAWAGVVTAPAVYSQAGAAGTGSITKAVTTPGTAAAFAATGNTLTSAAHGMTTGVVGQFTTSSALPTGLLTSTNYYAIVVDANTLKFASSLVNALAGTAVAITGFGVGNQTFTPTAQSGGTYQLQSAPETVNQAGTPSWVNVGSTQAFSTSVPGSWTSTYPVVWGQLRVVAAASAGLPTITCKVVSSGP